MTKEITSKLIKRPSTKAEVIANMQWHIEQDELLQGATGQSGKGCTVWCSLNEYNHKRLASILHCGEWLPRLADRIYEGLPVDESKKFSLLWIESVGRNTEKVKYQFLKWILKDGGYNTYQRLREKDKPATDTVYALLLRAELGDMPSLEEWRAAAYAAYAYADADAAAAAYAAAAAAAAYAAAAAAAAYAAAYADADAAAAARKQYWIAAAGELILLLQTADREA